METVHAVYFFGFRKPRRQIQTTKRKRSNTLIFAKKLPKRLIFYRAYNKNEEHKYSRSEFYYPKDLMQRLTQASANVKTICKVLHSMTNDRVKTLPATELDHFWSTEFVFSEQTQETRTTGGPSSEYEELYVFFFFTYMRTPSET